VVNVVCDVTVASGVVASEIVEIDIVPLSVELLAHSQASVACELVHLDRRSLPMEFLTHSQAPTNDVATSAELICVLGCRHVRSADINRHPSSVELLPHSQASDLLWML
jgi:hypothetical protein